MNTPIHQDATALAKWQDAMLSALWAPTHADALRLMSSHQGVAEDPAGKYQWRGLAAYRSHAAIQARVVLGAAYPVLERLLGENFDELSRSLWQAEPSRRGDLSQWGGALGGHIESLPELIAATPYLADVARVEWALHQAASASDVQTDLTSVSLLTRTDPSAVRLELAAGTRCIASAWPVVTLIEAHLMESPTLADAARSLRAGVRENALVWRSGWQPRLRTVEVDEAGFVGQLLKGRTLGEALSHAAGFDFGAWLGPAVRDGLLLRVVASGREPEPHKYQDEKRRATT